MSKNKGNIPESDDGKLDINKSVFQSAREIQEQHNAELARQQAEMQRQIELRERQRQEEYDRKNREERIELMRLKQGIIDKSETIHEEKPEEENLTLGKKIFNFFYHNKWWLGLAVFAVVLTAYLTYNLLSRPNPDMIVLILCKNDAVGNSAQLEEYLETFAEDFNGNGKIEVSTYYIPYDDENTYANYQTGNDTKLTTEMQSADAVIIIGGNNVREIIAPEETLMNLEEIFPENPHIKEYGFFLKNTDFSEKTGIESEFITDDLYIGLRKPRRLLYSDEEDLQETYDRDFPVFEKIIKDLSE
ncbi:MAG: hypothetical protein K2J08_02715 [Ruminococcus sp.]|nr:hypothetical protein [Ruminococcus sp.]